MADELGFMDFGGLQDYLEMEAGNRIELLNTGFAVPCITTLLTGH